ncbi:ABC transporter ATP-binding protein [Kitasatospora sp. NPDC059673]|uniref:ABC transporter ATP-binding protein n=1 Tax=Kitasatospora sp. NPDC059673 TaxID=3346901 RepID=UPI0036D1A91D
MSEFAIHARGLRKRYGDTLAVDSVDLDVQHGEIFALLGPNGAGKTTTTEILEGFRTRDGGELNVLGEDPGKAGFAWRSRIGIVLQGSKDLADLTVAEVVHHFTAYYPDPRDADEVIEAVGLTEKRKTRAASLSGGQRRRLDVALGIIGNPELLFLDEPTTGFDPEVRRKFWALIAGLRSTGTTILLTTHYLDEVEFLADRVGVVAAGRVVDVSTPERLGDRHLAPATVRWIGVDGPQEVQTATPTRTVSELSARFGGEVPELTVTRPSLEDVYLKMIGDQ